MTEEPASSTLADRHRQLFPALDAEQIETARQFGGPPCCYAPDSVVFAAGECNVPAFLLLVGTVVIRRHDALGHEDVITTHGPGTITGELSQLAGRPVLVEGRAGPGGCEVVPFDAGQLRTLVVGSAELGEIIMRAFILRRVSLIETGAGGPVLLGSVHAPQVLQLQNFLTRNGIPHTVLDPDIDPEAEQLIERFQIPVKALPVAVCPNGTLLRRPSATQLAGCLGMLPDEVLQESFDVAIVGAGPAGLATAVYAASEGFKVVVMEAQAFGGQAGASARIENYLGFPTGISGQALAGRAYTQAQKFGAEIAIPACVRCLFCTESNNPELFTLVLTDERQVRARAVVIASGTRYRRPTIPELADFEGRGVYYWASPIETRLCRQQEVILVGAGNSAGQAAVFLASRAAKVHLLVRGTGLEASMSRYLIDRIAALPNVQLHTETEIMHLLGKSGEEGWLEAVRWRHHPTGREEQHAIRYVFLFIGADPNTGWLADCGVGLDTKGFVKTGAGLTPEECKTKTWKFCERQPLPLETSLPGIFAVGDVRAGSVKRVSSAVGEGAALVTQLHHYLAEEKPVT